MKLLTLLMASALLAGCATLPAGSKPDPRDPWERFNRSTFAFNYALDKAVLKPVAKGYVKVVPRFMRIGVSNVFNNLDTLTTVFNDVLQGKMRQAGRDSARFLLNSTVGLGGLLDPATDVGLDLNDEDLGQTLGKWGVQPGPYLMLPFLGPTTIRDGVGRLGDQFTHPLTYLEDDSTRYIIRGVSVLDLRASLLDLDAQLEQTYDKYAFVRNVWLQRREFQVKDGEVDETDLGLDEDFEEDFEEDAGAAENDDAPQDAEAAAPEPSAPPPQP